LLNAVIRYRKEEVFIPAAMVNSMPPIRSLWAPTALISYPSIVGIAIAIFLELSLSQENRSSKLIEAARISAHATDLQLRRFLELADFCASSPDILQRVNLVAFTENCSRHVQSLGGWVVIKETGVVHKQILNSLLSLSDALPAYPRENEHQALVRLEELTIKSGKPAIADVFTGIVYPAEIVAAGQYRQIADGRDVMVYVSFPADSLSVQLRGMTSETGPIIGLVDASRRIVARSHGIEKTMFEAVPSWFEPALERGEFGAALKRRGPDAIGGTWDAGYYPLESAPGWMAIAVMPTPTLFLSWSLLSLSSALVLLGSSCSLFLYVFLTFRQRIADRVEETESARSKAEHTSNEKSRLLASFAHDVRNPLISIIDSIEKFEETDSISIEQIRATRLSIGAILQMVDDILELSYLGSGELSLRPSPVDLKQIATDLVDLHRQAAENKGLALDLEIVGDLPLTVELDRLRIHQVLSNLLSNAIKYTHSGAVTFLVSCARLQADRVSLEFAVIDTGIGLLEADIPCILREFGRLDRAEERIEHGTGLGLAIVQRILRLMGSTLHIESNPGHGSLFGFRLEVPVGVATEAFNLSKPLGGLVIVYAEDEPVIRRATSKQLEAAGAIVIEAADGLQTMNALSTVTPDLLLLDLQMPHMSGLDVIEQLRNTEENLPYPVFVLTANFVGSQTTSKLVLGADLTITKPIKVEQLAAAFCNIQANIRSVIQSSIDLKPESSDSCLDGKNLSFLSSLNDASEYIYLIDDIEISLMSDLQQLEAEILSGNILRAATLAHRARGLCQVFGAVELQACIEHIEVSMASDDTELLDNLLSKARKALKKTVQEMRNFTPDSPMK
jgi:signal transduction histidine kinase/CheY-like chemotaxis protein